MRMAVRLFPSRTGAAMNTADGLGKNVEPYE